MEEKIKSRRRQDCEDKHEIKRRSRKGRGLLSRGRSKR